MKKIKAAACATGSRLPNYLFNLSMAVFMDFTLVARVNVIMRSMIP